MRDLYQKQDYGRYGDKDGRLRVCFLTDAHTTSWKSGSAVVNAKGELVGINFDRLWQGLLLIIAIIGIFVEILSWIFAIFYLYWKNMHLHLMYLTKFILNERIVLSVG